MPIERMWGDIGGDPAALNRLSLTGEGLVYPSTFRVADVAQASMALATLAAAEIYRLRTGVSQQASIDRLHAAVEFRSERYMTVDGGKAPDLWDPIAGAYRCGDGRWVRIHTNFPHHRDGVLDLLVCDHDRDAVTAALDKWTAQDFEDAMAERGLVATMMRSLDEWSAHPQAAALADQPVISIEKIADGPVMPLPDTDPSDQPLCGLNVLDLTRVIAGPVCGRMLAAQGATVLNITAPHLPLMLPLVIDAGRGKKRAYLDLREKDGRRALQTLVGQADVFVQGYRPGGLADAGFSPEQAAEIQPGIIYASLSAYGPTGPWAMRRGFDSLVQNTNGMNHAEAEAAGLADGPKPLPCQALDHASGYFLALGSLMALQRRAAEGGSWHVRVSLARTGEWIKSLGRVPDGLGCADLTADEVGPFLTEYASGFGVLRAVRHAGLLDETPPHWRLPSMPHGSHKPEW